MTDIKDALEVILDRRAHYTKAAAYYEGNQRELFPSPRWTRMLNNGESGFKFNFAKSVVDSVSNRMEIASILGTNEIANTFINTVWENNDLVIDADEIHRRALMYGDSYAIAWTDENGEMQVNYNSPLTTVVLYDSENPRKKRFAAKLWQHDSYTAVDPEINGTKVIRLNLYYPDRIEKYSSSGDLDMITSSASFSLIGTVENPWGEIPVFHFRTSKTYGRPEHYDAYGPQDAINKLIITHMNTVDYQGAPQRYALANGGNDSEIQDFDDSTIDSENLGSLKNGPGELWYLKGITRVGEFSPADHKVFTEPVSEYIRSMAAITSTPLHYFEKSGNVPSGESLRTAEAPLLKKVADRQIMFGSAWRDLFTFLLRIEGINSDVQVKWASSESLDTLDHWEVAVKKRVVGVSLKQVLLEMGYDSEVADLIVEQGDLGLMSQGMNTNNVIAEQTAGN